MQEKPDITLTTADATIRLNARTGTIYSAKILNTEFMHPGSAPYATEADKKSWDRTELTMFPIVGPTADDWLILNRSEQPPQYKTIVDMTAKLLTGQALGEFGAENTEAAKRVLDRLGPGDYAVPMTKHGIARHYAWKTQHTNGTHAFQGIEHRGRNVIYDAKHPVRMAVFPFDFKLEREVVVNHNGFSIDNHMYGQGFRFAHGNHPSFGFIDEPAELYFLMGGESFTLKDLQDDPRGKNVIQQEDLSVIANGQRAIVLISDQPRKAVWTRGKQFCLEDLTRPMDRTQVGNHEDDVFLERNGEWSASMAIHLYRERDQLPDPQLEKALGEIVKR